MADSSVIEICSSDALIDGGDGVRFAVRVAGIDATGFVVRYQGRVFGYLNRCSHVALELDWLPGRFFDSAKELLVCATHGALYDPGTGRCVGGPCSGRGALRALQVTERDGRVYWMPDAGVTAGAAMNGD